MFIVEFIGSPGAGKSTIQSGILHSLQLKDKKVFLSSDEAFMLVSKREIDKVFRCILNILPYKLAKKFSDSIQNRSLMQFEAQNQFISRWGDLFATFLSSKSFEQMLTNERANVISAFIELGSIYECIRKYKFNQSAIFFEEGFAQKSFMFISPSIAQNALHENLFAYLNTMPCPDLIIHVNTNIEICHQRMLTRPDGLTKRLRDKKDNDIMKFLQITTEHLHTISTWLKEEKNVPIINIQNDGDIKESIRKTADIVSKIYNNRHARA